MLTKEEALRRVSVNENDLVAVRDAAHYATQEREWNIALNFYFRLVRVDPEPSLYKAIANIYIELKNPPLAAVYLDAYLKKIDREKDAASCELYARILENFLKANPKVLEVQSKYIKDKRDHAVLDQRKKFLRACQSGRTDLAYQIGKNQYLKGKIDPDIQNVWCSIAIRNGDAQTAIASAFAAFVYRPSDWITLVNISDILIQIKRLTNVIDYALAAVNLQPKSPVAWMNLGAAWEVSSKSWESIRATKKALELDPKNGSAWTNLGNAYKNGGDLVKALPAYRESVRLDPNNNALWSNLLFGVLYDPNTDNKKIADEHLTFGKIIESRNRPLKIVDRTELNKKIRIGFITADLRSHPVSYFVAPLFENIDKQKISLYVYDNHHTEDEVTWKLKKEVDRWVNIADKSDEQVIELIQNDKIDVLIDLSGHTAKNRLDVFARKPVALQVTWLGHPNTTGLSRIDYRLTDIYLDPEGRDNLYSEQLWRLPIHAAYQPLVRFPEKRYSPEYAVNATPALINGFITFGSCNNLAKLSPETIKLWSEILHQIPSSKLLIEAPGLGQNDYKNQLIQKFLSVGVEASRLVIYDRTGAMQYMRYKEIDIALDPFPFGGGTTTCDLLWMGVPLVSLVGDRVMSRTGLCFLSHIGHKDWAARDREQYKLIAIELASNIEHLNVTRLNLRSEVEGSPVMDGKAFSRSFEDSIVEMLKIKTQKDYSAFFKKSLSQDLLANVATNKIDNNSLNNYKQEYNKLLNSADLLMQEGKWVDALAAFEALREREGAEPNALFGIGLCSLQMGDHSRASRVIVDALLRKLEPAWVLWLGIAYENQGLSLPLHVVSFWLSKSHPHLSGVLDLHNKSQTRIAKELYVRGMTMPTMDQIKASGDFIEDNNRLAALVQEGKNEDALMEAERLIQLNPFSQALLINGALAAKRTRQFEKAARWYLLSFVLNPLGYGAITNFGNMLVTVNSSSDAMLLLEAGAIVLRDQPLVWSNLAVAYNALSLAPWEAEFAARTALKLDDKVGASWSALGKALSRQGRMDEAIEALDRAYVIDPSKKGNDAFTLQYSEKIARSDIAKYHFEVGARIEEECRGKVIQSYRSPVSPDKPLIIGYVTGDLMNHPVSYFMDHIFSKIDKVKFKQYVYFTRPGKDEDTVSARFKISVDKWVNVCELDDDSLATLINDDGVDILCDLAGHTAHNRLNVFGRKPAPVQFSYLGHPNTSGLKAIDWRVTDNFTTLVGDEAYYSEKLWRMPDAHCVYTPLIRNPELRYEEKYAVKQTPAIKNGFITFGCCNNLAKISDGVVELWSKILNTNENSKLLIESPGLHQMEFKNKLIGRFEAYGITKDRLIIVNRNSDQQYLIYNRIDIALDPFPYNGGTTTCDLLWFGVPLVALIGQAEVGRLGYSFVNSIGFPEWAAPDKESYVRIACDFAADPVRLNQIRLGLRKRVEVSPLMDGDRFVKNFERGLREMWYAYVNSLRE